MTDHECLERWANLFRRWCRNSGDYHGESALDRFLACLANTKENATATLIERAEEE